MTCNLGKKLIQSPSESFHKCLRDILLTALFLKGTLLQTGFLAGMETLLGVDTRLSPAEEIADSARDEVRDADQATDASPTETRQKSLNITYFEPVDEDDVRKFS